MKAKFVLVAMVFTVAFSSCKKDEATDWTGTYNGTSGSNNISRVVITKVNNSTIKMELQTGTVLGYLTYATIGNGKVSSSGTVTIDESGTVAGYSGTYRFTGGGTRNGNTLNLTGQATQSGSQTLYYNFSGGK